MTNTAAELLPVFGPETTVRAAEAQVSTSLGDNVVILSLANGTYYGLNEVGQEIWSMLQAPIKVSVVADKIAGEYEVKREVAEADIAALLSQLQERHLVSIVGAHAE